MSIVGIIAFLLLYRNQVESLEKNYSIFKRYSFLLIRVIFAVYVISINFTDGIFYRIILDSLRNSKGIKMKSKLAKIDYVTIGTSKSSRRIWYSFNVNGKKITGDKTKRFDLYVGDSIKILYDESLPFLNLDASLIN
ncbi:hypothetical protein NF867_16385 [Solitalea sp. MAHUQ-68]|uniref:DUF3592 domain-containing protein n=1 Tax=Solitalea agri TaxID=2953739 RepID=A0A9X2F513_9SPHI|nr:hypothetical protein [Solitalea agri]MCO4294441.1 hypothetical protein [Solitalea agri]